MGMSAGGGRNTVKNDINVTPLVDVVLVLLIIFLVTMPIIMRDINLDIPRKSEDIPEVNEQQTLTVEVFADGRITVGGLETNKFELSAKVHDALATRVDKNVFIGFEDEVRYGDAVSTMDLVKGAGATKVALKMKEDKPAEGAPAPAPASP
jgi:biopolymer transport protein TolR